MSMVSISTFASALMVGTAAGHRGGVARLTNATLSTVAATPAVKMALISIHAVVLPGDDTGVKTNRVKMLR